MSHEEKADFRATRNEIQFELEPCNLPWPDGFDDEIVRNLCDKFSAREDIYGRSPEEILEIKHLGIRTKTGFVPNKALALLAAKDPRVVIPGCRIRVLRFPGLVEGEGKTFNPLIDRFVEGNVVNLIQRGSALIDNVIYDFTWLNDEGKFVNTKEYPRDAWIEALVNAVAHRSYVFSGADITVKLFDDRMEIESPGGFCPPVTADNIYDVRASRNPFLMDAMYLLDYVKMAREGTRRMRESMATLGLPAPTFAQEAVHGLLVRVVLRNNSKYRQRAGATDVVTAIGTQLWAGLDDRAKKIIELVVRNGSINVSEAQQALNCSWPAAKQTLMDMVERGLLAHMHNASDRDTRAKFLLNSVARSA
jgi:ATP-dependent DNA helicase RecG